ncbi:MAG: nucleoside deaminase [Nitrospirae bacterium]|nr:nucleoside deaminase [Nitrospirota bacterium]
MDIALDEADLAALKGDVPVGAVAVLGDRLIARGHNQREFLGDPTAHAEMSVLREAAARLGRWRLTGLRLYVTLEPCSMCAGAIVLARISKLVFGCRDPKTGACGSVLSIAQNQRLNHWVDVEEGVRAQECAERLQTFFEGRRRKHVSPSPGPDIHAES